MTAMESERGMTILPCGWLHRCVLLVSILVAAACSPVVRTQGNLLDEERVDAIEIGSSRKGDVAALLGSPSAVATFNDDLWYYIGQKTESIAFFRPEAVERRVLLVQFDDAGIVTDLQELGLEDGQSVDIADRETPTSGREMSILEQFLGNIGRFSAEGDGGRGSSSP